MRANEGCRNISTTAIVQKKQYFVPQMLGSRSSSHCQPGAGPWEPLPHLSPGLRYFPGDRNGLWPRGWAKLGRAHGWARKGSEERRTSTAVVLQGKGCQPQWGDVSSWARGRAGAVVGDHQRQSMGVALRHMAVAQAMQ